jgi:hypothetical protein
MAGADPWWVEIIYSEINILQLNYPKVVQSAKKPATGQRLTYFVSAVQGPFKTKAEATRAAHGYSGIVNEGGVGTGGGSGTGTLGDIGDFFHRLSEKQTWVRVGEVALGGILLYIGVHATAQGSAAKSASKSVTRPVKKAAKTTVRLALPQTAPAVRAANARAKVKARSGTTVTRRTTGTPRNRVTTTTTRHTYSRRP